jgi:copper transport protein
MIRRAWLHRLLAVAAVAAAATIVWSAPASAHASLVDTEPAAQAVLDEAPKQISVRFNEAVGIPPEALRLFDSTGHQVDIGRPSHVGQGASTIAATVGQLRDGVYVVSWRAVSADSHPVQGAFTFQIGQGATSGPSASDLLAQVLRTNGTDHVAGAVAGLTRSLMLAALALTVGTVAFPVVTGADPSDRRWRRLRRIATAAAAVAGMAALMFQVPVSAGRALDAIVSKPAWRSLLETPAGKAALARATLLVAAAVAVWVVRRPSRSVDRLVFGFTAAAVVASSLAGHGGTGRYVVLGVPLTVAHTAAMGIWVGGLVVLAAVTLRSDEDQYAGDTATQFSSVAFACVAVLVATGLGQAWRQLGTIEALRTTSYGHLLLIKSALVGVMVAVGALSRRVVHHQLSLRPVGAAPADSGRSLLRRRVTVEIAVGAAVLAVTAALMATNPAQATGGPVSRTLVDGDVLVSLTVDPAHTGTNVIHVYLSGPGGSLQVFKEVTLTASLSSRDLGPLAIDLIPSGPNHYTAPAAQFPFAGRWQLTVTALVTEFDRRTLTTTVPIT